LAFHKCRIFIYGSDKWSCVFLAILEELVASGRLAGSLTGGRHDKAMYIPDVYVKAQNDWVDNFYKQNGYLGKYIVVTQFAVCL